MFEITEDANGTLRFEGRLDAAQVDKAKPHLAKTTESRVLDFSGLEYISSAGLGVLLAAQKRLGEQGHELRLVNVSSHIRDIFHFSGFDQIFKIE
ncbi:MAG: STAS domain-containing protein [Acidobacteria bacterium]|nr:STAS domain-containing protein [Acidobacteriota bacterium]